MFCQLDQVRQVLDIAETAKKALLKEYPKMSGLEDFSRKVSSIIFGLLLLDDYDVFIKKGVLRLNDMRCEHYWVELYLDGEGFILTALEKEEQGQKVLDVQFMPEDEAVDLYGLAQGQDYDWQSEDCQKNVWQIVLRMLDINRPLEEVLEEISVLN